MRRPWTLPRRGLVAAVTVVAGFAIVAAVQAAIPGDDGIIHGCYQKNSGDLRVHDPRTDDCLPSEEALQWGVSGPPGPAGEQGPPGAPGPPGPATDGFVTTVGRFDIPHVDFVNVAELRLGPGDYLVSAKLWVNNLGGGIGLGYCLLTGSGAADQEITTVHPPSGPAEAEAMSLTMATHLAAARSVVLSCTDNTLATFSNSRLEARDVVLSAITLGNLTRQ